MKKIIIRIAKNDHQKLSEINYFYFIRINAQSLVDLEILSFFNS